MGKYWRSGMPWTADEDDLLSIMAGHAPLWSISAALARTEDAVEARYYALVSEGVVMDSLAVHLTNAVRCPECGMVRHLVRKDGVCEICHREAVLEAYRAKMGEFLDSMPADKRERTKGSTEVSMSRSKMPPKPRLEGLSAYKRSKAIAEWERRCEEVLLYDINREYAACKSAMKRWRRL